MKLRIFMKSAMVCALTGILWMGGTAAYFSSYDKAENRIAVGRNETEVGERFPDPPDIDQQTDPQYEKKVWVTNRTSGENGFNVDCYVRAAVSYSDHDIGQAATLLGLDTENWIYDNSDGFYYYRGRLREGEATTPLFTGISIETAKIDPLYRALIREFQVCVYEESIQAGDFQDYRSAWDYWTAPAAGV